VRHSLLVRGSALRTLVASVVLLSCGDGTGPASDPRPSPNLGVTLISGETTPDTIGSGLPALLVLEVRDSAGRAARDVDVLLVPSRRREGLYGASDLLVAVPGEYMDNVTEARTGADGRVSVGVRRGDFAGTVHLVVIVPSLGIADSIPFTVLPGEPAQVSITPADTALYADRTYQLRGGLQDRAGNAVMGEVSFVADSAAVAVSPEGEVAGHRIGRTSLRASWGSFTDTAWVSVVPRGVLAATRVHLGTRPDQLLAFDLDGSNFRVVMARRIEYVSWAPTGDGMLVVDAEYYNGRAFVISAQGAERPLLGDYRAYETFDKAPRYTRDGSWVYFSGRESMWSQRIWRVRPDGSGAEVLAAPTAEFESLINPAPSPDNRFVAYSSWATSRGSYETRILDLETGATGTLPRGAEQSVWHPSGDVLVSLERDTFVLWQPGGTVVRTIPFTRDILSSAPFDVSPDGDWVVVSADRPAFAGRFLSLVHLTTGQQIPLPFTRDMGWPAWHP